jgi:hypothetical protein
MVLEEYAPLATTHCGLQRGERSPAVSRVRKRQVPETFFSWIPVLATFQAVEHGTQLPIARSLVFFETVRSACQICYASCEASTAPDSEYAPTEEAVGAFQTWVLLPAFEKAFEQSVQCLCFF